MPDHRVFIGVGSNIEPETNIVAALVRLSERMILSAISTFYRTQAVNHPDRPLFLNGVVCGQTALLPIPLKFDVLRGIEMELGRSLGEDRYADRVIDLDILLFGDVTMREDSIEIPHPDIRQRAFVSIPLLELASDIILPDTGERLSDRISGKDYAGLVPAHDFTRTLRERLEI